MRLDAFIARVLQDIDAGITKAKKKTGRDYSVRSSSETKGGVAFDVAVTTVSSNSTRSKGTAKVGFIEVVGAKLGTHVEAKEENNQVSRIQFSIHVPRYTETERKDGHGYSGPFPD